MRYDPKLAAGPDARGSDPSSLPTRDRSADPAGASSMIGVNGYWHQLSAAEIEDGDHRDFVGGMWDEIGQLQFERLRAEGLEPGHRLLDVGCGALRGGLHFARYLEPGK